MDEYVRVRDTFGYDDDVIAEFSRAAIDASFAPPATKARLRQATDAWLVSPAVSMPLLQAPGPAQDHPPL